MKRILCVLVALLLCLQFAPAVLAEQMPTITIDNAEFCTGNTAQIEVSISSNPGYCNITAEILYDATCLKLIEITPVNMPGMFVANPEANRVAAASVSDLKDDGTMFILHFEVLQEGEHTVSLELIALGSESGGDLPANVTAGKIKAQGHEYSVQHREVSCTVNGALVHTCEVCGDTYETDVVSAQGHVFDDAQDVICNVCGFDTSKPVGDQTSGSKTDGGKILLIVAVVVLIMLLSVLAGMVVSVLRRRSIAAIPLPDMDDEDFDDEDI